MNKKFNIIYFSFLIFIIISLIIRSRQEAKEYNIVFPIVLKLLNNRNAVVSEDGIHFYDESLTTENYEKNITFATLLKQDHLEYISMAQFDKQNGEYILILVIDTIYIFNSDETLLNSSDISSEIQGEHYSLIPYKKYDNDFIDFFILFVDNLYINIKHFKLDINTKNIEIKNKNSFKSFNQYGGDANVLKGINCIFMASIPSFNVSHELLTCFYCVNYPPSIVSSIFDQDDNFTEIKRFYQNNSQFTHQCSYVNGITGQNKNKALIHINQGTNPFYCSFDFNSGFSPIVSENENNNYTIREAYHLQKIIYNTITNEFVVFCSRAIYDCQLYILIYDINCNIKKKGILKFNSTYCNYLINYSIININGSYSVLINGKENGISVAKDIDDIDIFETYTYEIASIELTDSFTDLKSNKNKDTSLVETSIISDTNKMTYNTIYTDSSNIESTLLNDIQTLNTSFEEGNINTVIPSISTSLTEENEITDNPTLESSIIEEIKTTDILKTIDSTNVEENIITNIQTLESSIIKEITTNTFPTLEITFTDNSSGFISTNKKCKTSSLDSSLYNLCISCNEEQGYYQAKFPNDSFLHGFIECYNNETKPINFYFDKFDSKYKPCYETCQTCNIGGNSEINNCLTCDANHRKEPNNIESTNCITQCDFLYYYSYGQYKCTINNNCPEEANLYIKDLKKCTDDCRKEVYYNYTFQFGGQCLNHCPKGTSPDDNNICIYDKNNNKCIKNQNEINIQEFLTNGGIDINAKKYAKEFNYTDKHVSYFYDNKNSVLFYKDSICIDELSIDMPKIDFGNCYSMIKSKLDPPSNNSIIVVLIKKTNEQYNSNISYLFYHPETGVIIDTEEMCKDEEIIVKSSVLSELNNSNVEINSILFLTQQDINIFNLSDEFYTDICYHFESPNGKDITLSDRIKTFYPNITLCDSGCECKGVDLNSMETICECKFNDIMNNELIEDNYLISNTIGEFASLLSSSNLVVLKCYKEVFNKENIIKGTGGFIIIGIIFLILVFSMIFVFYDMPMLRKFFCSLSEYFIEMISNKKNNIVNNDNIFVGYSRIKAPPKKKIKKFKKLKKSIGYRKKRKKAIFLDEGLDSNLHKTESKLIIPRTLSKRSTKHFLSAKKTMISKDNNSSTSKDSSTKYICGNINIEEYLKPDLDDLEYDDAVKEDKRSFCEFICERLKEKQIIMNTFYYKENIRPITIKIILLLLNIDLYFVFNGFFYNEKYLSELFHSNEEETFFSFIPRSISRFIYTTLVGFIIGFIIGCIFIEERKVKRIFIREKDKPVEIRYEMSMIITSIKKRYYIFIFICLFISILSWYYVSCFNNVYPGVKIEWIKSSITIIIIMQILSIIIVLLEAVLRALSFHYKSEKLYKFKKLLS